MKVVVIGLGSMGKRRVRCLQALGVKEITGFELREDRRQEAQQKYGIETVASLDDVDVASFDASVISTPPDYHMPYMKMAVEHGVPCFVEASVILEGLEELDTQAKEKNVLIAPSCTLRFHPAIQDIKKIVTSGSYGKVTSFSYHSGQYLPDWHPWENVKDFYVSNKLTGACREIVPFELTWLSDIFGKPEKIKGYFGSTMDVGADIDDTYVIAMKMAQGYGTMIVDVVARYAVRSLTLNMEYGQILWKWDEPVVHLYEAKNDRWIDYRTKTPKAEAGYNVNIAEQMYIDEIDHYLQAVRREVEYQNPLQDDMALLADLYEIEKDA